MALAAEEIAQRLNTARSAFEAANAELLAAENELKEKELQQAKTLEIGELEEVPEVR